MPRIRVIRPTAGFLGRAYTYPLPRPHSSIVARLCPIAGHCPRPENPRRTIGEEKPPVFPRGGLGLGGLVRWIRELLESNKFYLGPGIRGILDSNR